SGPPPGSTLFPYTTLFRSFSFRKRECHYASFRGKHPESRFWLIADNHDLADAGGITLSKGCRQQCLFNKISAGARNDDGVNGNRSEEHTSELQSRENLVCR